MLSIYWVMLGHAFTEVLGAPVTNVLELDPDMTESWMYPVVAGGFFAVDTFFFLSSFLGAFLLLEKYYKKRMPVAMAYFHRVYRLMPAIMICVFFIITFLPILRNGPGYM